MKEWAWTQCIKDGHLQVLENAEEQLGHPKDWKGTRVGTSLGAHGKVDMGRGLTQEKS